MLYKLTLFPSHYILQLLQIKYLIGIYKTKVSSFNLQHGTLGLHLPLQIQSQKFFIEVLIQVTILKNVEMSKLFSHISKVRIKTGLYIYIEVVKYRVAVDYWRNILIICVTASGKWWERRSKMGYELGLGHRN